MFNPSFAFAMPPHVSAVVARPDKERPDPYSPLAVANARCMGLRPCSLALIPERGLRRMTRHIDPTACIHMYQEVDDGEERPLETERTLATSPRTRQIQHVEYISGGASRHTNDAEPEAKVDMLPSRWHQQQRAVAPWTRSVAFDHLLRPG
ncbi:hypothetical protein CP533_5799 [Ophiocordyceps camponoti-saundersi (nom. inval.)]|nr:hypothetical protein CP533_5799 [Ophiocordyceps camponoti-saundersi (nom. inval.)]